MQLHGAATSAWLLELQLEKVQVVKWAVNCTLLINESCADVCWLSVYRRQVCLVNLQQSIVH